MKFAPLLLASCLTLAPVVQADGCEAHNPVHASILQSLGPPEIIDPVKPASGSTVTAVVWIYPEAAHGKDVSVIIFDNRVQAITVGGEVEA